jgi:hypothetical protein
MVHVPPMFLSEWREFPTTPSIPSYDIGEVGRAKDFSTPLYLCVLCEVKTEILGYYTIKSGLCEFKSGGSTDFGTWEPSQHLLENGKTCVEVGGFTPSSGMLARCRSASQSFCDAAKLDTRSVGLPMLKEIVIRLPSSK